MKTQVFINNYGSLSGEYLFTIDYFGWGTLAETAQEHKSANIIKLDNGCFCAQPNNRILFSDSSLTKPSKPDYKASQIVWSCENKDNFDVSNDDSFFYGLEEKVK